MNRSNLWCCFGWDGAGAPGGASPRPEPGAGSAGLRRRAAAPLDEEREAFGPNYENSGLLFCWEDGTPPHPDTITRRFKQLARSAGLPEINLHDVRHSYATAGRDAKIDWKALSARIGHADVAFTMRQYVQTDLEADRQVANVLAELIVGGSLVVGGHHERRHRPGDEGERRERAVRLANPFTYALSADAKEPRGHPPGL